MYRIGRGVKKSSRRHIGRIVVVGLLAGIIAGAYWLYLFMQGSGDKPITPQAITREYAPPQTETHKTFDTPEFHMELPVDWVLKEHQTIPYNVYTYQAGEKTADNRWFDIYADNVPSAKAVNRLQPAVFTESGLMATGQISDNCYELAGNKPAAAQTYMGISFTCDVQDYTRNVVGVGVAGKGTTVALGGHKFVITYTDHNVRPNYQILEDMLKTFSVK